MFCDQRAELAGSLEVDERPMARAWNRRPRGVVQPLLPRLAPDVRIGEDRRDRDQPL
jgi:hypothetical protein